jgi:hypothetical protein
MCVSYVHVCALYVRALCYFCVCVCVPRHVIFSLCMCVQEILCLLSRPPLRSHSQFPHLRGESGMCAYVRLCVYVFVCVFMFKYLCVSVCFVLVYVFIRKIQLKGMLLHLLTRSERVIQIDICSCVCVSVCVCLYLCL